MTRRDYVRAAAGVAAVGVGAPLADQVLSRRGTSTADASDGDDNSDGDSDAAVLVAGSLLALAQDVSGARVETHGSVAVRRLLQQGMRDPDVVALADPTLFSGLADRVRLFATNALCLTYRPDSPHADAIADDWTAALHRSDCRVGRTDPTTDPLGYRTVLALRLAERFDLVDSARDALADTSVQPETMLLQVLESGKLDAAFVYRNMAREHGLPTVDLPERLDFSQPRHADTYGSVAYELDDRTVRGAPIRYAVNARTEAGSQWVARLLSDEQRLRSHGFGVPSSYPKQWSPDGR